VISRVLVAVAGEELRGRTLAALAEVPDVELVAAVEVANDIHLVVDDLAQELDVILIDAGLEGVAVLPLCKEVLTKRPDVGLLLLAADPSPEFYLAALEAGVRGVVEPPPSLEDLHGRIVAIEDWQRRVRNLGHGAAGLGDLGGRLIAMSGAKGGVGTTSAALHLALLAAGANRSRRVCLVDLDLQQRGVRHLLDLHSRRTIIDLVPVAESLTARHVDETVFVHTSGLRVLLAPTQGEHGEDIDSSVARHVLGALKSQFDLVIVDCGSVLTEAGATALELADDIVLVVTTDVPALRAAHDKLAMLSRLQVAKSGDVRVLFNRASPRTEVQPELGRRITGTDAFKIALPADWRHLEPVSNAAAAPDLADGPYRRAIGALGREMRLLHTTRQPEHAPSSSLGGPAPAVAPEPRRGRRMGRRRGRARDGEDGQVTIEAIVMLVGAMLVFLFLLQTTLWAMATVSSRRAADAAAISGSRAEVGNVAVAQAAAEERTPGIYDVRVVALSEDTYEAQLTVPQLLPFFDDLTVSATGTSSD